MSEESKLKYARLGGESLRAIFLKDSASCMTAHDRYVFTYIYINTIQHITFTFTITIAIMNTCIQHISFFFIFFSIFKTNLIGKKLKN